MLWQQSYNKKQHNKDEDHKNAELLPFMPQNQKRKKLSDRWCGKRESKK